MIGVTSWGLSDIPSISRNAKREGRHRRGEVVHSKQEGNLRSAVVVIGVVGVKVGQLNAVCSCTEGKQVMNVRWPSLGTNPDERTKRMTT